MALTTTVLLVLTVAAVCTLMFVFAASTLAWSSEPRRRSPSYESGPVTGPSIAAPSAATTKLRFSLIVPAQHEQTQLATTLKGLMALDHPGLQVIVVVGDDDPVTTAIARAWAARHPRIEVVVDVSQPTDKPSALNIALPFC